MVKINKFFISGLFAVIVFMFAASSACASFVDRIDRASNTVLDKMESIGQYNQMNRLKDQAKDKLGLTVKPYVKGKMEFTDNVFKEPDPDKEDVLWTITPGLSVTYPFKYGKVGASYEADFRYFTKYSRQNEQDQSFAAIADVYPTDELYVYVTEELIQRGETAGAVYLDPVNYLDNTFRVTPGYKLTDNWTLEGAFEHFYRRYNSDIYKRFAYTDEKYTARVYRKLSEDIKVYLRGDLGFIEYNKEPSRAATYYNILPGIEGKLPWDIMTMAELGFQRRHNHGNYYKDLAMFICSLSFRKQFNNNKTIAELSFTRRPVEATFENVDTYDEKLIYTGVRHLIKPKLRGRAGIFYANRDFEKSATIGAVTAKRDDDVFGANAGIDYAARKWLIIHVDYNFERRNSNISDFDYTENKATLGFTMPL